MPSARAALLALAALAAAPALTAAQEPPRTVRVGGDRDYPPYEFLDPDGNPAGFNVDLTRAIAETMGFRVEFQLGGWSDARRALAEGRIDVLQGMSWSEERARTLLLSPPHTIVNHAIWARKGTPPVAALAELRGHRTAVHEKGIMDETLTAMGLGGDLHRTGTPADALRALAAGEAEYAVVAAVPGAYITQQSKLTNLAPVARNVASHRYGYAVRRDDAVLLSRFEEGLAILRETGRYDQIRERWLGVLEPRGISWGTIVRYGAVVVVPLLLVLAGTVVWSRSLGREVAARTASLAREVAERKHAMELLRQNQAALVQADKLAALGVLVAGVAHEVNNPNGYILLNMPVLRDGWRDAQEVLDERLRERGDFQLGGLPYSQMREEIPGMLDEMLEGARRIKRIVEDLKDFARREDAPRHERVDLTAVAQAAVRMLEAPIRKATRRFETVFSGPLTFRGNGQRVEQVIVNLLLNACQALPDPGRAVRLRTERGDGVVRLVVEDEGVGIPPEHLARVTDPFFTTRRETGGTGLGLSVSASIVKEHGGSLDFAPRPGGGTVVTLALPALQEEPTA